MFQIEVFGYSDVDSAGYVDRHLSTSGSNRELWCILTGRSSILEPDQVKKELHNHSKKLLEVLDTYKLPSQASETKVKEDTSVKRKEFTLKLSKLLHLDQWQTHEVYQLYLKKDFRGSGKQLQAILKHDVQTEGFMFKVLDFYFKERIFLLRCLKYLLSYWQEPTCLFREQFATVVDNLVNQKFADKVIKHLEQHWTKGLNHDSIKGNKAAQIYFSLQSLKEQSELLEILLLYYKDFELSGDRLVNLAKSFQLHGFGSKQFSRQFADVSSQMLFTKIGYLCSLILLEGIDLVFVRKAKEEDSSVKDHHLVTDKDTRNKLDEVLSCWGDALYHGPVLMSWTIFRLLTLEGEDEEITKRFGQMALQCSVFDHILGMLKSCPFNTSQPLGNITKSIIYTLLSLVLTLFYEDTLGDPKVILELTLETLNCPGLSVDFLASESKNGLHLLLTSVRNKFPYFVCPLIDILTTICHDQESAETVFDYMNNLISFTELFGKNRVDEVEATGESSVWKRTINRVAYGGGTECVVIPAGTYGRVSVLADETRLVRWQFEYSGWLLLSLEMEDFIASPLEYVSDSGENGIQRVTSIVKLISKIMKHVWVKAEELEPSIARIFTTVQRFSQLPNPPLELISVCLNALQILVEHIPRQIWNQFQQTGFLPKAETGIASYLGSSGFEILLGHYGQILSIECSLGYYHVTKEYLNFILELLSVTNEEPSDDISEDTSFLTTCYPDIFANVIFILKNIFANFGRWKYVETGDKERIAQLCLQILHTILASKFDDKSKPVFDIQRDMPRLQQIVSEGLLSHGTGEALLHIISTGVDIVDSYLTNPASDDEQFAIELIQAIKFAFSVVNLLLSRKETEELTPLEHALCMQYVKQPTETDFVQATDNYPLISVIAKYIYHYQDPKLCTLAVIVLQKLCLVSPISISASFDQDSIALRNAFVSRLQGIVEPVRLKIAILEFLSAAVESQPGLMELFLQLRQKKVEGKEKEETTIEKFSCLHAVFEFLDPVKKQRYPEVLNTATLQFLRALWFNRRDSALTFIRTRESFWANLSLPLKEVVTEKVSPEKVKTWSLTLEIITLEMYYVEKNDFDKNLIGVLKDLVTSGLYAKLGKILQSPKDMEDMSSLRSNILKANKLTFIETWRSFLLVGSSIHREKCLLDENKAQEEIVFDLMEALKTWAVKEDDPVSAAAAKELAYTVMTLLKRWSRFITDVNRLIKMVLYTLKTASAMNERLFFELRPPLFASVLSLLQEQGSKFDSGLLLTFLPIVCESLQFHQDFGIFDDENERSDKSKVSLLCVSLLGAISCALTSKISFCSIIREHSTLQTLFQAVDYALKKKKCLDFVEATMSVFVAFTEDKEIAEAMTTNGLSKLLSLSLAAVYNLSDMASDDMMEDIIYPKQTQLHRIWCLGLMAAATTLKTISHSFLQGAIDFTGAHRERLLQATNIVSRVQSLALLQETEAVSRFLFELSHHQAQWRFALPEVMIRLQAEVVMMTQVTVAFLARPRLLNHLVESPTKQSVELLLERARTPTPPLSVSRDGTKGLFKDDATDQLSSPAEEAQERLLSVLVNCIGTLQHLTPNLVEAILDEGMDVDSFSPLVDLGFNSPSLDQESPPSFGCLVSCLTTSLKLLYKISPMESPRSSPAKSVQQTDTESTEKRRELLTFIMENTLIIIMSQSSCYLRHPGVEPRTKQFLKRELGSELSNFLNALHRYFTRRGIPPSPASADRLSAGPNFYKRSPSKLGPAFAEDDENTVYKIADLFTKQLQR